MLSTRLLGVLVFSRPNGMKYDFRPIVRAAPDSDQDCLSYPLNKRRTWEKNRSCLILLRMDLLKDLRMNASLSKALYSLLLNPWRNAGPANQMRNFPHKLFFQDDVRRNGLSCTMHIRRIVILFPLNESPVMGVHLSGAFRKDSRTWCSVPSIPIKAICLKVSNIGRKV
jgi:hypothetical protein